MTTARELKRSGSVPKSSAERGSRIRVIVRKRPLSQYEKDLGIKDTMVLHTNGSSEAAARGLTVSVAFYEVYRGKVLDLLGERAKREVLEDGRGHVSVVGLRRLPVESTLALLRLVKQAASVTAVHSL